VRVLQPTQWAGRLDKGMATRKRCAPEQVVHKPETADRMLGEGKDVADVCREKQVAIVVTTDNWLTFRNASGNYQRSFPPNSSRH
jgi:hypothetical protein